MIKNLMLALVGAPLAVLPLRAQTPAATLATVEGSVTVTVGTQRIEAKPPLALDGGAQVATGPDGVAVVVFANGSKMRIAENSVFVYEAETRADTTVQLLKGLLTGWIKHLDGRRLNIRTPTSVASVRGTVLTVATDGKSTSVDLFAGSVSLTDRFGRNNVMTPGQRAKITLSGGIVGTSSMPTGTRAPVEPAAGEPAPAKRSDAADKKKTAAAPPSAASEQAPQTPTYVAPPPAQQQQQVVSPSAP